MGKWNKATPQISEQFLQNEERRKQMIIEAARRRKQKQKKQQNQAEQQKKNEQQALTRHKQQKKDAYVKYLRSNMHDKYEQMKRNEKLGQPEVRSKSKWKKDAIDQQNQLKSQLNLEGLDLQVNVGKQSKVMTSNKINSKAGGNIIRNQPDNRVNKKQQKAPIWQKQLPIQEKKQSQKRRMLQDEFQNMWKQDHQEPQKQIDYELSMQETVYEDMMGSKLLDSLDLDFATVTRGRNWDKKLKEKPKAQKQADKEIDEIKDMIGYESVLMSIDERSQMIKKYNQFMINQVQQPIKMQQAFKKDLSKDKATKNQKTSKEPIPQRPSKPLNEGEVFNQLKNKKEGKILNWAQEEAQQADDLFSNCSIDKKSRTRSSLLLKEINKQIQQKNKKTGPISAGTPPQQVNMKKKQRPLQTIPQKKMKSSIQKLRQRSYEKKNPASGYQSGNIAPSNQNRPQQIKRSVSKQKIVQTNKPRPNRLNSAQNRNNQPPQPPRNVSRERASKTTTNSFKQSSNNYGEANISQQRNRTDSRRSLSKQKQNHRSERELPHNTEQGYPRGVSSAQLPSSRQPPIPQSNPPAAKKLPHLPPVYQKPISYNNDTMTIATQQQVLQVQSFIKNQLLSLNRQQRQLQQQLKNIHVENKDKVKEVQRKYQIKTDYKYSHQLRQKEEGIQEQQNDDNQSYGSYQQAHKRQSEDQLEESIQRLDDMLMRREIVSREKQSRITELDNQSNSTHRSIINPMSDPIALHKQVLQLAENLSRFEGEPEDIATGYGGKLRMMQKRGGQNDRKSVQNDVRSEKKQKPQTYPRKQIDIDLSQSQDVNYSQINSMQEKSKISKFSKVSKPPSLYYEQVNCNIPAGYGESGILDDQLEDSIQKGKIQVNQRLKRMLLD